MKLMFFDQALTYLNENNKLTGDPFFGIPITGAKKFLLDNIHPSLPQEIKYYELPNLAPPYPEMWFEWHDTNQDNMAVYARAQKTADGWGYGLFCFSKIKSVMGLHPVYLTFQVPASGKFKTGEGLELAYYAGRYLESTPVKVIENLIMDLNNNHIGMMLFAISLMHCKNIVEIEKGGRNPNVKNRRHRSKGTKHYVLDVVPARNINRTEYEQPAKGTPQRMHFRRGHFKEYTSEKPLFGKYTGTFWWEAHVAGSAAIGEIRKDYRILPIQQ
jgi:hypothetical protein